jgi:D-psicose/D-tagatose/L-ribulose 3-epimerase
MNKLGIFMNFWENTWKADHVKYIEKAAKIGFDVLEFQAQPLLEMSKARMDEIKAAANHFGIELTYSLGLDKKYDISSSDRAVREGGIKYLSDIMSCVSYMNGKIISGVSYAGWGVPANTDFNREELTENSVNSMKILIKQAESSGITYGIEAVNRFEGVIINTAKEAVNYVNMVDSKNVGVLLDTYHMNIEEDNMGDAIRTAGDKLIGLHTGENNRQAPGRGHINWDEIFKALKDVGFKGRIVSEPFVVKGGEVGRDIYVWRNLIDDVSEAAIDREAEFLLDFEKSMMKKWGL